MVAVQVDIATRFVGTTEDLYVIRPGENFSLYNDFMAHGAVFLDFPDLRLDLAGPRPRREQLREAIVRSMDLRAWHRSRRTGDPPSRDSEDYSGSAGGRRVGHYAAAIERLYFQLPVGTIIVVPGPGYFSEVLIGELSGPAREIRNVESYPGENVIARSVRWIGRRPKARFSPTLRDRLQKPTPLMAVDRSLREEILEAAFDQFSIGDTFSSRLRTTSQDFSTLDDFNIQVLVNYVSGLLVAVEERIGQGQQREDGSIDLDAALALLAERRDFVSELTAEIHSPGAIRFLSSKINPIVVSLFFQLAVALPAGALPDHITVINSAQDHDPCALQVQEHAVEAVRMMDLDTWQKVCIRARDAAGATGASSSISVVPDVEQP